MGWGGQESQNWLPVLGGCISRSRFFLHYSPEIGGILAKQGLKLMSVCFSVFLFIFLFIFWRNSFSPDKLLRHAWSKRMTEYKETLAGKKIKASFQRSSGWVRFAFVDSSQERVCVFVCLVESQLSLNS